MRYIGSKEKLLGFISETVNRFDITSGVFCDLFAGTTTVGRHFKRKGFQIISNDLMEYSFVFGKAYIETNALPQFENLDLPETTSLSLIDTDATRLENVIAFLNQLTGECGFIFSNYCDVGTAEQEHPRMFFSESNAKKIDVIRDHIEVWRETEQISTTEFYILLASLLEAIPSVSNTSGTYAAFLKFWESRSQKTLTLAVPPLVCGSQQNRIYRGDATQLAEEICCDVLYLDPPYNSRQYATNYHILETVARWDNPKIYGKSGLRPYTLEKSAFCNQRDAISNLDQIASKAKCRLLLLSYSSDGIMPHESILEILGKRGQVQTFDLPYRRYRSDSDHAKRKYKKESHTVERIYAVSN